MAISGVSSSSSAGDAIGAASAPQTSGMDNLANENTFLKLMIAQIRNQDPMNPSDGTQFLTQLAQFTNLEQTIAMKQDISSIRAVVEQQLGTDPAAGSTGDGNSSSGASQTQTT